MKKVIIFLITIVIVLGIGLLAYKTYFNNKYEIKLLGDEKITINLNEEYVDPGAEIKNNGKPVKDYMVDNNVDVKHVGTYEIKYKVDKIEKTRIVNVVDNESPVIKLVKSPYFIIGSKTDLLKYVEVKDNYDEKVENIKIEGKYNLKKEGLYKIKYVATDSNNNESVLETTINVQKKNTSGIPVLMYHWFYDDTKGETYGSANSHNFISKTEFEKQIKYLKNSNYYFPTWDELIKYIDGKIELPSKSVILTDDDCVGSFFKVALKVAQKYEVPITSFCITKKDIWKKYQKNPYLILESHTDALHERKCNTYWDGAVMCSSYKTIYNDIKRSIDKIKNTDAFAYPFGHYNDDTIKALKKNNIKLAFTIREGRVKKGDNKYLLPRVRISRGTSLETFKRLVK